MAKPVDQADREKIDVVPAGYSVSDPIAFRLEAHAEVIGEIVLKPQAELPIPVLLAAAGVDKGSRACPAEAVFGFSVGHADPAKHGKSLIDRQNADEVGVYSLDLHIAVHRSWRHSHRLPPATTSAWTEAATTAVRLVRT